MKIRAYLPLYIGCYYQVKDLDGQWRRPHKLDTYELDIITQATFDVRLVLRSPHDITESERQIVTKYLEQNANDEQGAIRAMADSILFLISKRIDLWGLIDQGLAVNENDKTLWK